MGAADILRGCIDSADYKNYIFGLMFLKRLSDRFEEEADETIAELVAEGVDEETAEQVAYNDEDVHEFYIPDRARWGHIRAQTSDIGATLTLPH